MPANEYNEERINTMLLPACGYKISSHRVPAVMEVNNSEFSGKASLKFLVAFVSVSQWIIIA